MVLTKDYTLNKDKYILYQIKIFSLPKPSFLDKIIQDFDVIEIKELKEKI